MRASCSPRREGPQASVPWVTPGSCLRNQRCHSLSWPPEGKEGLEAWVVWVTASSLKKLKRISALLQLKLKEEVGYMVNNPRAIGTKWMQEEKLSSDTLVGRPRLWEGVWTTGAHGKVHTVQHNVGSITTATGRWTLSLGIKDACINCITIQLCSARRRNNRRVVQERE